MTTIRSNTRSQVLTAARLLQTQPLGKVIYLTKRINDMVSTDTGSANWKVYQSGIMRAYVRPSKVGLTESAKGDPGRVIVEVSLDTLHMISFGNQARWHMVHERLLAAAGTVEQEGGVEKVTSALRAMKEMGLLTEAVRKELAAPLSRFLKKADVNPLDLMLK